MSAPDHDFEIGTNVDSDMINLQDLTVPVSYPKTAFHPFSQMIDLDDLTQRGVGLPSVVWNWNVLLQNQRDQLRTYCPAPAVSSDVIIRTRTNDTSAVYSYYEAKMIWPSLNETYDSATRQSFSLTFRNLVLTSPSS